MTDEKEAKLNKGKAAFDTGDYKTAFEILSQLVETKDAEMSYCLGYMYEMGLGVTQNYDKATYWYTVAFQQEHILAQFRIGRAYYYGLMCAPQDFTKAKEYLEKAADRGKGIPEAQYLLGTIHENGEDVEKNSIHAHMWYNLAAANGYDQAASARDAIAKNMERKDIFQAQRHALDWFER